MGWNASQHVSQAPLDVPEIVGLLQAKPVAGGDAGQSRQSGRHLRGDGGLGGKQAMQCRTGDTELACRLADRQPEAGQHAVVERCAGVRRPTAGQGSWSKGHLGSRGQKEKSL
jgi:hypothetical protein